MRTVGSEMARRFPLLLPELVPELGSWHEQALALSRARIGPSALLAAAPRCEEVRYAANLRLAAFASPAHDNGADGLEAGMRAQDEFFGIRRVRTTRNSEVFLTGFISAHLEVLHDARQARTRLAARDWPALLAGAKAVFADADPAAVPDGWEPSLGCGHLPDGETALRRWHSGHRLFFVLTQAIVAALTRFTRAVAEGDDVAGPTALEAAVALHRSAAAAMRFTSNFSGEIYNGVVRPSMTPPHVPPGFSGAHHGDHQLLVGLFRRLGPVLASVDGSAYPIEAFRAAAGDMFSAHLGVCSRFGGKRKPSLLMEAEGHTDPHVNAVIVLRQLIRGRTALLAEGER